MSTITEDIKAPADRESDDAPPIAHIWVESGWVAYCGAKRTAKPMVYHREPQLCSLCMAMQAQSGRPYRPTYVVRLTPDTSKGERA